jgi:TIR domain/NACHT domain
MNATADPSHAAFLCHASEDKLEVATPLANSLSDRGWKIWIDESELTVGDSLLASINEALAKVPFGIVVLSPAFFLKEWPLRELQALASREFASGEKVILPVWHGVDRDFLLERMPMLADRLGVDTKGGINAVTDALVEAFGRRVAEGGHRRSMLLGATDFPEEGGLDQETLGFGRRYGSQVRQRLSQITPPHVDSTRKVPINDLYVPARLEHPDQEEGEEEPQSLEDFAQSFSRTVILGNPGGGKSTLSKKVCYDIGSGETGIVPVLVILRDYGVDRADGRSIVEHMELTASGTYQLPDPPDGAFDKLLSAGRAVVVFDGLDELLDASYRQEIAADVESFCNLYPAVPVLVTSREVGYSQAPLDEGLFVSRRLSEFSRADVALYAQRWFASIPELARPEAEALADAFLRESAAVPDLRKNALMLALMCNIYRGERYIPSNRPDVYEKCARMLFERWDRSRGIEVELPFRSHLFLAMQHLAYWVYQDQELQTGVRADALVQKTSEYLLDWQYEDPDEAQQAAAQFVEFCAGRAWVFADTGLASDDTPLYQFTHRTFLEYFTAAHLARVSSSPDQLMTTLAPRIAEREWDIVGQLSVQMTNQASAGAADYMLDRLIDEARKAESAQVSWNILAFAARSLEFLVPKPRTRRSVARATVEAVLGGVHGVDQHAPAREAFQGLLKAVNENQGALVDEVEQVLVGALTGSDPAKRNRAADLGARQLQGFPSGAEDLWINLSARLVAQCDEPFYRSAREVHGLGVEFALRGRLTIAEFVDCYGLIGLYEWTQDINFGILSSSLSDRLLAWVAFAFQFGDSETQAAALVSLGELLPKFDTPWVVFDPTSIRYPLSIGAMHVEAGDSEADLSAQALFGFVCLLAPLAELDVSRWRRELRSWERHGTKGLEQVVRLLVQKDDPDLDLASDLAVQLGFDLDQRRFVLSWLAGETALAVVTEDPGDA